MAGHAVRGLGAVAILFSSWSCSSSAPASVSASAKSVDPPPAVQPRSQSETKPNDAFIAVGPVVVEQQVDVAALREGVVSEIKVDVDSPVKKGQLLAKLDDRQLTAQRDAAEHKLRSVEDDVKNWESELQVRQVDLQRSEAMLKAGIVSQQQVDHDTYNVTATQYEVDRERENMLNQRSTLQALELEMEKTRIVAPFDGVVARRYVRDGQRVGNGDKLFWITATSPLQVRFTLPEQYSRSLKTGDELVASPAAVAGEPVRVRVMHISPVVDPASGTVEVIALLDKSNTTFRPGMTASIRIPREPQPNAQ